MNIETARRIKRVAVSVFFAGMMALFVPVMPASTVHAKECDHDVCEWVTLVKPTCSKAGKKVMICQDCEQILETESIEKTEHKGKWEKTKESTCAYTGIKSFVCKNCNAVIETEIIPRKSHKYVWNTTKISTCSETGIKQQICKDCGAPGEAKSIETKAHKYGNWSIESIKVKGKTIKVIQSRTCMVCNKNKQVATGTTASFLGEHGKKKYAYKYLKRSGKIEIFCSGCHQSVTGKISGGTIKFTKPKKDTSRHTSKAWKVLKK